MLTYNLTQRKDEPKYYYIYKSIRKDIEGGTLKKGEKLPSKRSLAEHLGVSLITIENAYHMLKEDISINSIYESAMSLKSGLPMQNEYRTPIVIV